MKVVNKIFSIVVSAVTLVLLAVAMVYLIDEIMDGQGILFAALGLWVLVAYLVLPRIHRFLTKIYLPDYFIGRTKTGDGFYGDPVNIALLGSAASLHAAMKAAGWAKADPLNFHTSLKMIRSTVRGHSYKHAPVSTLYLFSRPQDFAYQQEVKGNPRIRHHVRFWKTPKNWWLPGGEKADWVAAATFDKHIGISLYTGQFTHKITGDIDIERDYVISTLLKTKFVDNVRVKKHFTAAFHERNGGGDKIKTDGSLPFITLKD